MGVIVATSVALGLAPFALVSMLALGVLIATLVRGDMRQKAWDRVAARLSLTRMGKLHVVGELAGSSVEADVLTRGSGKSRVKFTRVRVSGSLPKHLSLTREGFFGHADDHRTGDAVFDRGVRVGGDAGLALAILDEPMRAMVLAAVRERWSFAEGTWTFAVQRQLGEEVGAYLEQGAALADEVRQASLRIAPRLVARVKSDGQPGARLMALRYLLESFRGSAELKDALAAAIRDTDAAVRLAAASELRDVAVLAALATDDDVEDGVRAGALEAGAKRADAPETIAAVTALVARAEGETGVLLLGRKLSIALADALRGVVVEGAEGTLIALLDSKEDDVRYAAMGALGVVGTVAAVRALTPFRDRLFAFASKSAALAKEAILAIQARADGAEAGALAVVDRAGEAGDGALAVVERAAEDEA